MTLRKGMAWVGARMRSLDAVFAGLASGGGPGSGKDPARGSAVRNSGLLSTLWAWLKTRREQQLRGGRLRVTETVSLGEKRFVSVVEVDGQRLLIGGGSAGVSLLARLEPGGSPSLRPAMELIRSGDDGVRPEGGLEFAAAAFAPGVFADVLRRSSEVAG